MSRRLNKEIVGNQPRAVRLREGLARLSVETNQTKLLESAAPDIIFNRFSQLGITPFSDTLTPTYFIPDSKRLRTKKLLGDDQRTIQAAYIPQGDVIFVFTHSNPLIQAHRYFHEQVHSLGLNMLIHTELGSSNKVGYYWSMDTFYGERQLGHFLEEAVNDYIAAMMSVDFASQQGVTITEREITELADEGESQLFYRDALEIITQGNQPLLDALLQGRFSATGLSRVQEQLRQTYGPQSLKRLNALHGDNVETIIDTVNALVDQRRNWPR